MCKLIADGDFDICAPFYVIGAFFLDNPCSLLQVAFFTNQMGIAKGKLRPEVFKSKVEDILTTLHLPVQVNNVGA